MAKKYLKNENGIVRAVTSDNLQLEKPLLNENYDIEVHNRNMDKIDSAIQEVKGKIDGLELVASNVKMADGSTVQTTVTTNKSNITTLQSEVSANKTSILNNTNLANQALTKANEAFQRGDNVKTQLVDKLISEGLDVSTNNTFDELISGIALGKKWASGTVSITSSTKAFNGTWGSTSGCYYAEVSGFDFIPSTIVLYNESQAIKVAYNKGETYKSNQIVTSSKISFSGGSGPSFAYFTTSPCVIDVGHFLLPTGNAVSPPLTMSWIAFE